MNERRGLTQPQPDAPERTLPLAAHASAPDAAATQILDKRTPGAASGEAQVRRPQPTTLNAPRIPGYAIEHLIAEGGMAYVYLATQESLGRRVALKILKPQPDPSFSERFLNEGRIVASLRHRNIVTIHDINIAGDLHYISMEYIEGGDLAARIAEGITPEQALALVEEIGVCLAYVHSKGVIHRDIKPTNILFDTDGTPLLADFGLAKRVDVDASLTSEGLAVGSPYYLSPEQGQGKATDARTDIYSVGVVLYEMLAGEKPFVGESSIETVVKHVTQAVPRLPDSCCVYQPLVDRMLAKAPNQRYRNADGMVAALRELTRQPPEDRGEPDRNRPASPGAPGRNTPGAHWGWLLAVMVLLSGLGAATALSTKRVQDAAATTGRPAAPPVKLPDEPAIAPPPAPVASMPAKTATAPPPAPNISTPAAAATTHPIASNTNTPAEAATALLSAPRASTPSEPAPEPIAVRVERLLQTANARLQNDKLTVPAGDSAWDYLRQVLSLDPNNKKARRGIDVIANRYAVLTERAIARVDHDRANRYLTRGLRVDPAHPRLRELQAAVRGIDSRPKRAWHRFRRMLNESLRTDM